MLKIGLLSLGLMLVGCTERISDKVNVLALKKSPDSMIVIANFEKADTNFYQRIIASPSQRLVCDNFEGLKVDTFIKKIQSNSIETQIQLCQNNDNRICKPIAISKPVDLQCQFVFSQMFGGVMKSEYFHIRAK